MDRKSLEALLEQVATGETPIQQAIDRLARPPVTRLEGARIDIHRELRTGHPEVIYGEGKKAGQIVDILKALAAAGQTGLVTRVTPSKAERVLEALPAVDWFPDGRILCLPSADPPAEPRGCIAVVCAGTSDLPVANEAALVAEIFGNRVIRLTDVGVAGIHRLLSALPRLEAATVIIVVAGMEGALASVVAGMVARPVIAVPTSVGYGASFGGLAALLGMLSSCAAGVSVVNIDNGFGAAIQASLINRLATEDPSNHDR